MSDSLEALVQKLREMAKFNDVAAHVEKRLDIVRAEGFGALKIDQLPSRSKIEIVFSPSRSATSFLMKSDYNRRKLLPADRGEKLYKFTYGDRPQQYDEIASKLIPLHVVLFNNNYYLPWLVKAITKECNLSLDSGELIPTADDDFGYYQNMLIFEDILSIVQTLVSENPELLTPTAGQDKHFVKLACDAMTFKNFRKAFAIVKDILDLKAIFKAKQSWAYHFLEMVFLTMSRIVFHLIQYEESDIPKIAMEGVFQPRQLVADVFRSIGPVSEFSGPEVVNSFNEFCTFRLDTDGVQADKKYIVKVRPTPAQEEADKDIKAEMKEEK